MNKNLIGISGKKRSGKNATATIINEMIFRSKEEKGEFSNALPYQEKSFAYLVKKFASELTGIPMEGWETEADKALFLGPEWNYQDETGNKVAMTRRMMLKKLGSDACNQNLHKNCWVNGLFQNYDAATSKWMVTDVRFPQEVEAIRNRDGIVIRVVRPATEDKDAHISETALDGYTNFDYMIYNDGTLEELTEKIRLILEDLKLI